MLAQRSASLGTAHDPIPDNALPPKRQPDSSLMIDAVSGKASALALLMAAAGAGIQRNLNAGAPRALQAAPDNVSKTL